MYKLGGLYHEQIQGHYAKKINVLTQYLSNLSIFDSKLRLIKYVKSAIFHKFYKDIENLVSLGGTKVFNLKSRERINHLLHSSTYDKHFCRVGASEAPAWA